jgi:hypothetical protein
MRKLVLTICYRENLCSWLTAEFWQVTDSLTERTVVFILLRIDNIGVLTCVEVFHSQLISKAWVLPNFAPENIPLTDNHDMMQGQVLSTG